MGGKNSKPKKGAGKSKQKTAATRVEVVAPPKAPAPVPKKGYIIGQTEDIKKHYTLGKRLGEAGQFGHAVKATHKKTGKVYAVKVIPKARFKEKNFGPFRTEIALLQEMNHRNVIKGFDCFETPGDLYIVMEFCGGGELFERIQAKTKYNERAAAEILRQLMEGLQYMHSKNIAHCDLKPDNFLFMTPAEDSQVKIIDFGMSKHVKSKGHLTKLAGTSLYMAPEVLQGNYTWHCDVWSMGVVMFIMLYGYPPFHGDTDKQIHKLIQKGFEAKLKSGYGPWFSSESDCKVSASARDLMGKMLMQDPVKRLTATEVLEHPWMMGKTASSDPLGQVLIQLKSFTSSYKLKQKLLASFTDDLSDQEIKDLRKLFKTIDKNNDGILTMKELQEAAKEPVDSKQLDRIQALIANVDVDGDGQLNIQELILAAVNRKLSAKEERLYAVFQKLDVDGSGTLSPQEIEEHLGISNAKELIAEVDKNGDGQVDWQEFLAMWKQQEGAK